MTEQELKKLRKGDLLEILLDLSKENEVLRAQLDKARSQLTSRTIAVEKSGSLAEAALRINGVFEAAQAACDQYTQNLQQRMANQEQICEEMEGNARAKAARLVAEAQQEADKILFEARQEAEDCTRSAKYQLENSQEAIRSEVDAYRQKLQSEADTYSFKTRSEADNYSQKVRADADTYSQSVRAEADMYSQNARNEADNYRREAQKVVKDLVSSHDWLMNGLK